MAETPTQKKTDPHDHGDVELHLQQALGPKPRLFGCCPGLNRAAHVGIALLWIAAVGGQIYLWNFFHHPQGNALPYLITYSMAILLTVLTLLWWILFAPVSWRVVWSVAIPALILIVGFVGSIRRPDFRGDMEGRLIFRWQKTQDQVLEEYRRSAGADRAADVPASLPEIIAEDMPQYRGQDRDGVVASPPLREDWSADPPTELWRHPVGGGYSSFATAGNLAITLEQRRDDEAIVCYDVQTGGEMWEHRYPAHFREPLGGPGPRSTPTIHGDSVYSLGAQGDLYRLDLRTGEPRWHVNILGLLRLNNATWGMAGSPLIVGQTVVVNAGGPEANGLVALSLDGGELVWAAADADKSSPIAENRAGYSSPMLVSLHGRQLILNFDGHGLRGVEPDTGRLLWSYHFENGEAINVAQPLLFEGGRVLISAGYGKGSVMLRTAFDAENSSWRVEEDWTSQGLRAKFSSPLAHEGNVYGLDEGIMVCLDAATGERLWKGGRTGLRGRYGHGQMLLVNGKIIVLTERGELVLIDPSPQELRELASVEALSGHKTWNVPAFSRGRLLVRNAHEMACFDLRASAEPADAESAVALSAAAIGQPVWPAAGWTH